MIEIKNQIVVRFSVGPYIDFIEPEDFEGMLLCLSAGNILPTIEVTFKLNAPQVLPYLNEGNILNVSFGINETSMDNLDFMLMEDNTNKQSTAGHVITLTGIWHRDGFTDNEKTKTFSKLSSIAAMQQLTKPYFNFKSNIENTNDRMNWQQSGMTDWQMIQHIWLHSYINDDTFIMLGHDGKNLIMKDVRRAVREEAPWLFTNAAIGDNTSKTVHFGQYHTNNDYGLLNQVIGRNTTTYCYNTDSGKVSIVDYKLKNFTVLDSDKVNINPNGVNQVEYAYTNDSNHSNWIKAYKQNVSNLLMYECFNMYISYAGQFKALNLLDTCRVQVTTNDTRVVGTWFISAIAYQISNMKLLTNVTLSKEAPNEIAGNNLIATSAGTSSIASGSYAKQADRVTRGTTKGVNKIWTMLENY